MVLKYWKGTSSEGMLYIANVNAKVEVIGYVDVDHARDLDKRRSLTEYMFTFSENIVSWRSILQPVVALLTTKAECIAINE